MGRKVEALKRLIVYKGGTAVDGTIAELVKILVKQTDDVDVPDDVKTIGDVLEYVAKVLIEEAVVTIAPKNSVTNAAITGSTIVVKTGTSIGSGTTVDAETNGTYLLKEGGYNVSVSKTGYATKTATFTVTESDVVTGSVTISVAVVPICITTFVYKDSVSEAPVTPTSVTLKTGSVQGSGTAVTPVGGNYLLPAGSYNISVVATGYTTKEAIITIINAQVVTGTLEVDISLVASE